MTNQHPDASLLRRLLNVLADDVLPLTEAAVQTGNKVFGAALLRKSDQTTYLAATNNEMESPLFHGETHLLKLYFEIPQTERVPVEELYFLSTHEPCSMCLSAITWSGFDNFCYFFSHEDSRDAFNIPHDLKILDEVFSVKPGQYNKENAFWKSFDIVKSIENVSDERTRDELRGFVEQIKARYDAASEVYQSGKTANHIPLN